MREASCVCAVPGPTAFVAPGPLQLLADGHASLYEEGAAYGYRLCMLGRREIDIIVEGEEMGEAGDVEGRMKNRLHI